MLRISYQRNLNAIWITIARNYDLIISWRKDWKFCGLSQHSGFGKYIGIKF